jgi:hypothetical protein
MIGVLHPFWFVALAVIPLIRWLHRWQAPMATWTVSAIFLWEDAIQDDAPGPAKRKPDPAWRRRATVAALLITALANPFWRQDVESLTVWIDDSLSMATRCRISHRMDRRFSEHVYLGKWRHSAKRRHEFSLCCARGS